MLYVLHTILRTPAVQTPAVQGSAVVEKSLQLYTSQASDDCVKMKPAGAQDKIILNQWARKSASHWPEGRETALQTSDCLLTLGPYVPSFSKQEQLSDTM